MLQKILIFACAATVAQALRRVERNAGCQRSPEKRKTKSVSPMRVVKQAEMKEPGYGDEPNLKQIYYINQDRAGKRMETMEKKLQNLKGKYAVARFPAIKPNEARKFNIKEFSTGHKNQEVNGKKLATYFSHWHILKHIANQTKQDASDHTDVYFVLEDDVEFKRKDWADQVMCHISKLPADWDFYKFGYWEEASKERGGSCGYRMEKSETLVDFNKHSCFQRNANIDTVQWMGNQGYAVTPSGARHMLEHLSHMPVMDVDGAMMPHGGPKMSQYAPNNYYARQTLLGHDTAVSMAKVRALIASR